VLSGFGDEVGSRVEEGVGRLGDMMLGYYYFNFCFPGVYSATITSVRVIRKVALWG
jgi:hypothetical protein